MEYRVKEIGGTGSPIYVRTAFQNKADADKFKEEMTKKYAIKGRMYTVVCGKASKDGSKFIEDSD